MSRVAASLTAILTAVGLVGAASGATLTSSAPERARITSVAFSQIGGQSPLVTIHGSGFGAKPTPSPTFAPTPPQGNTPPYGCSATGKVGWNYGTKLWVSVTSSTHSPWSAGRYRPALQELDCVGIVILRYTGSQVRFRLGAGYHEGGYKLIAGDRYTASVNGATKRGVVG
jgi:hypothetical protein